MRAATCENQAFTGSCGVNASGIKQLKKNGLCAVTGAVTKVAAA